MLCLLKNCALQRVTHLCIHVSGDGYLWSRFNNAELLSITCRTANISVAMVDSSPPKFCLHFWGVLCILENYALHICVFMWAWMLWLNRVQQYWAIEQHMQNCEHDLDDQCRDVLAFSKHTCQMLLLRAVSVATLESFILIFPYKLFRESLRVQNVVTFFQHQCKITWRKLCFQGLHQWLLIITIATLGGFGAMLQQANNLNETF